MGVVVAAQHLHLGQRVAIKFMHAEMAGNEPATERFLREGRAAVALTSEHVARVLDVGTLDDGAPYIVMEYLSGEDLAQALRRDGPMPVSTAVAILLQACEALAEAHAIGIVHRDLKPANLFVTRRADGSRLVKVLDFGISKAARQAGADAPSLTATGVVMGSPSYMSPEQVRSSKDVDARSDVWSLGVILYEMLTAISPFEGETLGDTFAKVVSESPPPVAARRSDVPRGLVEAIDRCLERDRAARVQSVSDLARRLLPFAPPEAAISVERILRMAGASQGPSGAVAPATGGPNLALPGTERPWLRSGTLAATPRRWGLAWVVAGGVVVVALAVPAAVARYALRSSRFAAVSPRQAPTAEGTPSPQESPPPTLPPAAAAPPAVPSPASSSEAIPPFARPETDRGQAPTASTRAARALGPGSVSTAAGKAAGHSGDGRVATQPTAARASEPPTAAAVPRAAAPAAAEPPSSAAPRPATPLDNDPFAGLKHQ
jgi:serine/threonine-protein kinase